jgi:hypothetical protein
MFWRLGAARIVCFFLESEIRIPKIQAARGVSPVLLPVISPVNLPDITPVPACYSFARNRQMSIRVTVSKSGAKILNAMLHQNRATRKRNLNLRTAPVPMWRQAKRCAPNTRVITKCAAVANCYT